jgi:hypothetical protein
MANTLTGLIPVLYQAVDIVSRELVGFIPAVTLDAAATRAAVGQTVTSPVAPAASASDITPGVTPPDDGDQTIGSASITINKSRRVPVRWNGEQTLGVNSGVGQSVILRDQFAQAMRTLVNEIEGDLAALYVKSSRAYGTAGATPFGTAGDYTDASNVRKILVDNGAPQSDLQLVINTAAGASIRGKQSQAHMAGTDLLQRQGILLDINGLAIRESAQVKAHTKGTGAGYAVNNASNYAAGSTTIALDTGSGTILAGDILTNSESGRDANKYVVGTALAAGSLVLNAPGLRAGWTNDDAVAVGNSYAANLAFHRGAIQLAARAPALPAEGDLADDRIMITDSLSGLTFEIALYKQYRQIQYEVSIAWGVACNKPEHCAILLG